MTKPKKLDDPLLQESLLNIIAEGHTIKQAAEQLNLSRSSIAHYCVHNAEFARKLDRARHEMANALAEECLEIADGDPDPQRARNRIDARKWFVATVNPRVYSPKAQIDVTIEDRTDFGARIDQARARIAKRMREMKKQDIEDAVVVGPEALPAPSDDGRVPLTLDIVPQIVPTPNEEDPFS